MPIYIDAIGCHIVHQISSCKFTPKGRPSNRMTNTLTEAVNNLIKSRFKCKKAEPCLINNWAEMKILYEAMSFRLSRDFMKPAKHSLYNSLR